MAIVSETLFMAAYVSYSAIQLSTVDTPPSNFHRETSEVGVAQLTPGTGRHERLLGLRIVPPDPLPRLYAVQSQRHRPRRYGDDRSLS